ncbi:MAG: hypothetical protein ACOX51_03880 [Myxococcota bacterium]|jgi:hypothetical protein
MDTIEIELDDDEDISTLVERALVVRLSILKQYENNLWANDYRIIEGQIRSGLSFELIGESIRNALERKLLFEHRQRVRKAEEQARQQAIARARREEEARIRELAHRQWLAMKQAEEQARRRRWLTAAYICGG